MQCPQHHLAHGALHKNAFIRILSTDMVSYNGSKLVYDLVPKGVHENRTKGVENKVDDTLKLVVFLECAQC